MSSSEYSGYGQTFIQWFCSLEDHSFLCEVDEDFITDNFNLYGLKQKFNNFNECIEMILSPSAPDPQDLEDENFLDIYQEAVDVYGLIHARFILSPKGVQMMKEKFLMGRFGVCPRVLCERQHVIPVGMSEELRTSRVKVYCPKCQDVYIPKKKCPDIDGAYFGCSFPQFLLINCQEIQINLSNQSYVPRIFGFKIYKQKGSKYYEKQEEQQISNYSEEILKKLKNKSKQ